MTEDDAGLGGFVKDEVAECGDCGKECRIYIISLTHREISESNLFMDYPELLKNNAARKAQIIKQAEEADRFNNFIAGLQELCTKFDFKDHDDFLAQMAEYHGISIDDLKAMKGKSSTEQAPEPSTGDAANSSGETSITKRFYVTEPMTIEAKAMHDGGKTDAEIATHFKCKPDLIGRLRERNWVYKKPGNKGKK